MADIISYKRWAIKQRIEELTKALKRIPKDLVEGSLYRRRQQEIENLKRDLDE